MGLRYGIDMRYGGRVEQLRNRERDRYSWIERQRGSGSRSTVATYSVSRVGCPGEKVVHRWYKMKNEDGR